MLLLRKLPGWPPSGLRLPHKFVVLLFLSGLLTLCFGALFLLPDSSRFRRLFLPRRGADPDLTRSSLPPPPPGSDPGRHAAAPSPPSPLLRDPRLPPAVAAPKRERHQRRPHGPPGAGTDPAAAADPLLRQTRAPFRFDHPAFLQRLRHPVLGRRRGRSGTEDPALRFRRLKIKEVMPSYPSH
uniref:Uncharacterized protein n=1 Tax=Sphaerodactylus townsendi TaxID=933632 RepID=A0ACB8FQS1_9SAUR